MPPHSTSCSNTANSLPAAPGSAQPSSWNSASSASTPKMMLMTSKATEATHDNTELGRLPRMPNAARVRVLKGNPARTDRKGKQVHAVRHPKQVHLPQGHIALGLGNMIEATHLDAEGLVAVGDHY